MTEDDLRSSDSIPRITDRLIFAGIALATLLQSLIGEFRTDADTVAYLDLSDAIRNHDWHHAINAYWFPFFPAQIALGRALFGFRPQFELTAARLVNAADALLFILASVLLAAAVRGFFLLRGLRSDQLLPARTLYLSVAVVAWMFASLDFTFPKPDALVSAFIMLALAATFRAVGKNTLLAFGWVGLFGALAFWAKAFAFPVFIGLVLLTALVHLKKPRILAGLGLAFVVFAAVAGPYIAAISELKGRFTFGDAGRMNTAWFVNGADRLNPVNDPEGWQPGSAIVHFTHPSTVLSTSPRITYNGGTASFGTTPQWTDPSYWSDGLAPRFVLSQYVAEFRRGLPDLAKVFPMRLQALVVVAALSCWGFAARRPTFTEPMVAVTLLLGFGSICLYLLVLFEARYVAFVFVMFYAVYAASAVAPSSEASERALNAAISGHATASGRDFRSLHVAVCLISCLALVYGLQSTLREAKTASQLGARPLQGILSAPVFSAGVALHGLYPQGGEVACMGDTACMGDPYWARYGGMRMTAMIETGRGSRNPNDIKSASQGCQKLEANPEALDALRQHNIEAIVGFFDRSRPCSAAWKPLGEPADYFLLPLQDGAGASITRPSP